jgi:hypothetical protein
VADEKDRGRLDSAASLFCTSSPVPKPPGKRPTRYAQIMS